MIKTLSKDSDVHELVPVGSHGIAWEAKNTAALHHLTAELVENSGIDLNQSGGPSSCILAVMTDSAFARHKDQMILTPVGHFV